MWYEIAVRSNIDITEEVTLAFYDVDVYEMTIEDPFLLSELSKDEKSWDYVDENILNFEHQDLLIKACLECDEEKIIEIENTFKEMLAIYLTGKANQDDYSVSHYQIDPDEFKDEWKKYFKPFYICDGVMVCPSWEKCELEAGDKLIDIDPSGAFGTGNHETTSMCARFINKYIKSQAEVLDVGCGSGILSLVAMNLDAKTVLAFDTDKNACQIAEENAIKNGFAEKIEVINSELNTDKKFDLVVANIIADVILMISQDVKRNLKEDAVYITSGIISERRDEVVNHLESIGFRLIDENCEKEWSALCFRLK